ncbi:enoyl-CoA hydratase-related protein [Microbacterium gorillae]|uniref:enoyl-CoA hydratase-related protein n=1 Tax=Microbacterium gorillae TaxID=1231063 RepID=UPI000590275A|nr:enoyl-CoA hydratase-related protein [Microbacterium gorillae]
MAETVLVSQADGVVSVTFNRPDSGNALDLHTARLLAEALEAVSWDATVAVVLRGAGRAFCVGGDLREMVSAPDRGAHLQALAGHAHRAVRALASAPVPVVAVVDGAAAGAGLAFVLGADVVLAGDRSRFVLAYGAVGLTPDCGASWFLPRIVGRRRAYEIALTNPVLDGDRAERDGIVTRRVGSDQLEAELDALLGVLRAGSGPAVAGVKALLLSAEEQDSLARRLDAEAESIARFAGGEDAGRRIAAFLGDAA